MEWTFKFTSNDWTATERFLPLVALASDLAAVANAEHNAGTDIDEEEFEKRMFIYYYRIFDKHELPVFSMAILADDNPPWRPQAYQHSLWNYCHLRFEFLRVKLLDFESRRPELMDSHNPFAIGRALAHGWQIKSLKQLNRNITSHFE